MDVIRVTVVKDEGKRTDLPAPISFSLSRSGKGQIRDFLE